MRGIGADTIRNTTRDMGPRLIITSLVLLLLASCTLPKRPDNGEEDPARALYDAGRTALLAQDFTQAARRFQRLIALYPEHEIIPQVRMELAYSYYKEGDPLSAMATAERFIRDYPDHPALDYLFYLRALAAYEQSIAFLEQQMESDSLLEPPLAALAMHYFTTLVERFPGSKYSSDARQRLAHLQEELARLGVLRAKQALARGEYATAALHARSVMEQYPGSIHSRDAEALLHMTERVLPQKKARDGSRKQAPAAPERSAAKEKGAAGMETARAQPSGEGGLRDADWLLAQPGTQYTLQLLATRNRRALINFVKRHGLQDRAAYFVTQRQGAPWYTLVYGIYADRRTAVETAAALPTRVQLMGPWPRRLAVIQDLIHEAQGRQPAIR